MIHIACIAAHDTSNGAGITRDCIVAHDWGIWAHPVITAITAQSFHHVTKIYPLKCDEIIDQVESIFNNFPIKAVKIGMLYDEYVAYHIATLLKKYNIKDIVLDPIIYSSGGEMLLTDNAFDVYLNQLIPIVSVLTPNKYELQRLSGKKVECVSDAIQAAQYLVEKYDLRVLLKSGHFVGKNLTDFIVSKNNLIEYNHQRVNLNYTHGTGCVLSTSYTCCMALGMDDFSALKKAVRYTIDYFVKTNKKISA